MAPLHRPTYAGDKLPNLRLEPWADELRPDLLQVHAPVWHLPGFDPTDPELKYVHQHFDWRVDDADNSPLLYLVGYGEAAIRFRDFTGPYVFHCHNLEHEDAFMMATFNVVDGPVSNNTRERRRS